MNRVPNVILLVVYHRGDYVNSAGIMIEILLGEWNAGSVDRVGTNYERETRDEKVNGKKISQGKFMCQTNTLSRPLDHWEKGNKPWKTLLMLRISAHARSTSNVALWALPGPQEEA